jgi:hypothetical protein
VWSKVVFQIVAYSLHKCTTFGQGPKRFGFKKKVVHYIGNRLTFGTHANNRKGLTLCRTGSAQGDRYWYFIRISI